MPAFSDPTNVTNPLFPVSRQRSVLLLGRVDGPRLGAGSGSGRTGVMPLTDVSGEDIGPVWAPG